MSYNSKIMLVSVLAIIPRIMPAILTTYYCQNYAATLGQAYLKQFHVLHMDIIVLLNQDLHHLI